MNGRAIPYHSESRKLQVLVLMSMCLSACSGGDENPSICNGPSAESAAVQALNQGDITRDPCQASFAEADSYGSIQDAQIQASLPTTQKYDQQIARLKQKASINQTVQIRTVTDIQAYLSFGGGVTGHNLIYIDGKLLDVLEEYSNFLAVSATTRFNPDPRDVLNQIVADHSLIPGVNIPAKRFPRTSLGADAVPFAEQYFDELSGAITYHEYGHFWAYGLADSILLRFTPTPFGGSLFYYFPSKVEDDADFISGVLSKKAGHRREIAEQLFDIMAFLHLYRGAGLRDIRQVESSYIQYLRSSSQYQSLLGRKQLFGRGYN